VLRHQRRLDEAIASFRAALEHQPDHAPVHNNLGLALSEQLKLDEAEACYRRSIALTPEAPDPHFNLGLVLLAKGEMQEGWREYEWRWRTAQTISHRRKFPQPQWHGAPAAGRTLLIHAEQGFGDTLQFCRYAPLAAARGLRVILGVPKSLTRLLRCLPDVDKVIGRGDDLPPFDLHCPMLSLPLAFGTTMSSIPAAPSYLRAEAQEVAFWGDRLAAMNRPGLRVGLVWAGQPGSHSPVQAAVDRRRSIDPARLAPIFDMPGLHLVSLQKTGPAGPAGVALTDFMDEMEDFAATAALIANLDLVIAVDTAVAHLAAALGKPVWLMSRFDACWRWLTDRRDSPWYPSLRLYRQPEPDNWSAVLAEITRDLHRLAQSRS